MIASVEIAAAQHVPEWTVLRAALWPGGGIADHVDDVEAMLADEQAVAFVAIEGGSVVGFAEASIRHDHVNGCDTTPVAFLEGLYVAPAHRRAGVARALCATVADWGRTSGCDELASDADIDHHDAHAFHLAAGFAETERVVFFRQTL